MKTSKYLVLIIFLCVGIACNTDDDSNKDSFSVQNLISSEVELQILPSIDNFVNSAVQLNTAVELYQSETTETNLLNAQTKWKTAAIAYEKVYTFNIGEVRDNFLHLLIYPWPITTNAIENTLTNNSEITQELIDNLSPRAKSFAALEYLLFKSDLTTNNVEFVNSEKRLTYLKFSSQYLKSLSERLQNIWIPNGANYGARLIANNDTGIDGSFNLFFNGIYNIIDTGKVTKIGKPGGLENSAVTNTELTQAYYSNTSLKLLKSSIESVENTYFNPNGLGVDDYVFSITKTEELNTIVQEKIEAIYSAIDTMSTNLVDAINTEPQLVSTLHSRLNDLKIVFGVDLRSTLSIVITSTDNDGD